GRSSPAFSSAPASGGRSINPQKLRRFEGSAAYQPSVDVLHREQLRGLAAFDAAAVEDPEVGGYWSIPFRDHAADQRVNFLRLIRGRGPPGADRPNRFVRDDRRAECGGAGCIENRRDLALDDRPRLVRLALLERLADAED